LEVNLGEHRHRLVVPRSTAQVFLADRLGRLRLTTLQQYHHLMSYGAILFRGHRLLPGWLDSAKDYRQK
jgi:hypothetical protein